MIRNVIRGATEGMRNGERLFILSVVLADYIDAETQRDPVKAMPVLGLLGSYVANCLADLHHARAQRAEAEAADLAVAVAAMADEALAAVTKPVVEPIAPITDPEEMERLAEVAAQGRPSPEEAAAALAAAEVQDYLAPPPLPAPPGTGEVLASDPHPKTAQAIDTPPARGNRMIEIPTEEVAALKTAFEAAPVPAASFDGSDRAALNAAIEALIAATTADPDAPMIGRPEADAFLRALPPKEAAEWAARFAAGDKWKEDIKAAGSVEAWVRGFMSGEAPPARGKRKGKG